MVCLYLLQGGPFYKSHQFAMLSIKHLLDILENAKNVEALLVISENMNVVVYSPIIDYSGHLDSVKDPSLCEFTLIYEKNAPIEEL